MSVANARFQNGFLVGLILLGFVKDIETRNIFIIFYAVLEKNCQFPSKCTYQFSYINQYVAASQYRKIAYSHI